ncbi:MAG: hypothetical protein JWP74_918 [Marmoricola sp.]|nr:hypothetical protein [Marmoricola sp.]
MTSTTQQPPQQPPAVRSSDDEPTIGELVGRLTEQSSRLMHQEVALAKAELRADVQHAGAGAGLFGGAGLFAVLGLATLVAAAVAGLATTFDVWLSALIVAAALFVIAGVAALVGKREVGEVGPPERTIASVKDDVDAVKDARS